MQDIRVGIVGLFCAVTISLFFTAYRGRQIVVCRKRGLSERRAMFSHILWASITCFTDLVAICLTEKMVRENGGIQNPVFFGIHIPFAICFEFMLVGLLFRPCLKILARNHQMIARFCLLSYGMTLGTGIYLILHVSIHT